MTTELEKEFFKYFEIEPDCAYLFLIDGKGENKAARTMSFSSKADLKRFVCECGGKGKVIKATGSPHIYYPEITDRKLLQLLCIYNDMQDCIDLCITPCKYEDVKEMILQTLIDEKTNITDYKEGTYMDVMTKQIQQLFKEEE